MSRLVHWTLAVVFCAHVLIGCAEQERRSRLPSQSQEFKAPYEQVWEAACAAPIELAYTIASTNQARGTIVAVRDYPASAFEEDVADAMGKLQGRWWRLETTLILSVQTVSPQQTRVAIEAHLMGRTNPSVPPLQRSGLTIISLQSNGRLERQLLERVATDVHRRSISTPP